jgi:hypothetical protein
MVTMKARLLIAAISLLSLITCIDPYSPKLKGYESLLVVDGLISDENCSYSVRLSRTIQDQNAIPPAVSDAVVSISDDLGDVIVFNNRGNGIYKSDSLTFRGMTGRKYVLHIVTGDGEEYKSTECHMLPVPEIDSLYFERDQQLVNNKSGIEEGLRIYVDSEKGSDNLYYRWAFEETWKFKIPNPKRYDYLDQKTIIPVKDIKQYCWKDKLSQDIVIHGLYSGETDRVRKQPVCFIASDKSDRLMSEYSILVKQYSVSESEFEFWNNLKQVNENGGDIYAAQPFPVISNIISLTNPGEQVLGFFQVSAMTEKRLFVPFSEIVRLHLPFYHSSECGRIEKSPSEYSTPFGPAVTFDDLYNMFCVTSDYTFIEPMFNPETYSLEKLVFARPECANCELTGSSERPDFWVDLN